MKVVIDASNLAHYGKERNSKPKLKNILFAVDNLEENGHEYVIIADASLKHEIDAKKKYMALLENEAIEEVPSGTDADHFILNLAEEENAKILSNDFFREFFDEFKDINSKRLPYSFENDKIIIGKSQKPKKAKNILQNIANSALFAIEQKRIETYTKKDGIEFSPLNIAKESIIRMDKSDHSGIGDKIEGIFSKLPMFDKVVGMVENVETSAPYVIFVLVNPKNYKEAVKNAGNISVTIGDRLRLDKNPLIAVRNDLYMGSERFELNILYSDEVEQESRYNIEIRINNHDQSFIKKNSRNIASTIAGRMGSWKFPIVFVKPDVLLENPGDFEVYLSKPSRGGNDGI